MPIRKLIITHALTVDNHEEKVINIWFQDLLIRVVNNASTVIHPLSKNATSEQ